MTRKKMTHHMWGICNEISSWINGWLFIINYANQKAVGHVQSTERKRLQIRIWYAAKLSFRNKGENMIFSDKQKWRELIAIRPTGEIVMGGSPFGLS